jgi:hypothetical protein
MGVQTNRIVHVKSEADLRRCLDGRSVDIVGASAHLEETRGYLEGEIELNPRACRHG